jgi:hypothetical protein
MSPITAMCLGVFPKDLLVALVLVPADVPGMGLWQQRVPLLGWHPLRTATTVLTPE